ncbi:solute carrier family 23 protein [Effusibacillus consociatus]|uniref:Solute carrier family 23 protein n=1 Tax=Effusibacillus consociatus TaxID=1117041 RepID=A0ABV9Q2P2_9BACL
MSRQRVIDVHEKLPVAQALPLSLQHLFAMFGATVLVPFLTGLNPAVALLTSGIGTLLYIFLTKGQIPGYLGSSFAFIAPIIAVSKAEGPGAALFGAFVSGIVYIIVAAIVSKFGVRWLDRLLPPVAVMGGISILLFGIIASAGLRMLVESGIDYSNKRNLILSSVIMVVGVGGMVLHLGQISIESMALATFVGIVLNLSCRI